MLRQSPLIAASLATLSFSVAFDSDTRGALIIPQNPKFIYNKFV